MRPLLPYLLVLLCFVASCNIGGSDAVALKDVPDKTTNGADIIVCMVNGDLNYQVYREERGEYLFPNEEIFASPFVKYTATGDTTVYLISGDRRPDDRQQESSITLQVMVENPEIGVPYRLYSRDFAEYWIGNQSNEYRADTNASMIRFTRIDKVVGAGDFMFIAVNNQNDTVTVAGYFDVRFDH